jgi:hypothetical protein
MKTKNISLDDISLETVADIVMGMQRQVLFLLEMKELCIGEENIKMYDERIKALKDIIKNAEKRYL